MVESSFKPSSPFSFKITPHFTYGEFCNQEERRRFTAQHQCETAKALAEFLESLRAHFGKAVIITSGHRPSAVNQEVGGASDSEHLYDKPWKGAVDVKVKDTAPLTVESWIEANWPLSVGLGQKKQRGFTHVGMRGDQQKRRWDY